MTGNDPGSLRAERELQLELVEGARGIAIRSETGACASGSTGEGRVTP